MSTQPYPLRLAEMIERYNAGVHSQAICEDYLQAASELRRLHEVNQELIEACVYLDLLIEACGVIGVDLNQARKTIAKAKGEIV